MCIVFGDCVFFIVLYCVISVMLFGSIVWIVCELVLVEEVL